MKKLLLPAIMFSLVLASGGNILAEELHPVLTTVKATSTQEIRSVKIKKATERKAPETRDASSTSGTTTKPVLEKIAHPGEISLFEKIKKIGTTLWGIRKEAKVENSSLVKPVAVQCVKDAINKKDTALRAALSVRNQSIYTALDNRNTCQKSALNKASAKEQLEANKACVESYKRSIQDSGKALKESKNNFWQTYKNDLKSCSILQKSATSTEAGGNIMIDDGENLDD